MATLEFRCALCGEHIDLHPDERWMPFYLVDLPEGLTKERVEEVRQRAEAAEEREPTGEPERGTYMLVAQFGVPQVVPGFDSEEFDEHDKVAWGRALSELGATIHVSHLIPCEAQRAADEAWLEGRTRDAEVLREVIEQSARNQAGVSHLASSELLEGAERAGDDGRKRDAKVLRELIEQS